MQRIESSIQKRWWWLPKKTYWKPFDKKSLQCPVRSKQVIQEAYSGSVRHTSRHQWCSCHGSSHALRKRSAEHPLPSVSPSVHHLSLHSAFGCSVANLLLSEMSPNCQGISHLLPVVTSSDIDVVTQKVPQSSDTQLIKLFSVVIKSLQGVRSVVLYDLGAISPAVPLGLSDDSGLQA